MSWPSIHGPSTTITIATAAIFGTRLRLCSWIWVTAWKTLTITLTTSAVSSSGPATFSARLIACVARLTTVSWFIARLARVRRSLASVEALHQRLDDEVPAVDEDEQQHLEGQGDEGRRQHDHPHAHQHRRDDQVDDQEGQAAQEADLERGLPLRDDAGGDQDLGGHFGARLRLLVVREVDEQLDVLGARLLEHELAHRDLGAFQRLLRADVMRRQRFDRRLLDRADRRRHHEDRQEQGDPDEHLVRGRVGRAERGADEPEHDQDAAEAGDREED